MYGQPLRQMVPSIWGRAQSPELAGKVRQGAVAAQHPGFHMSLHCSITGIHADFLEIPLYKLFFWRLPRRTAL